MDCLVINGKIIADNLLADTKTRAQDFISQHGRAPKLGIILVGSRKDSQGYVNSKRKRANQAGLLEELICLDENATQEELNSQIENLSSRKDIDGVLLQLPLPDSLNEKEAIDLIPASKDVDGITPRSLGRLIDGQDCLAPCTALGVVHLIKSARTELGLSEDLSGLSAVVIGRSSLVGKPTSILLQKENCTVTLAHSKTEDLKEICRRADIIVSAVGKAKFIDAEFIKPQAIAIDVGISSDPLGKLSGDFDFDSVSKVAAAITPVPGGVGPMTIAMLLSNLIKAAKQRNLN
jgi:methylenetetrahydrofolate dehydrogenase (NADP+)/methenyltetrahydrofolate cyclohydrolase